MLQLSTISLHKFPLCRFRIDVISSTADEALQTFHFVLFLITGDFCINRLSDPDARCNTTAERYVIIAITLVLVIPTRLGVIQTRISC